MIVFEVKINGQIACTAGVGESGVLDANLFWVKRDPATRPTNLPDEEWAEEEMFLTVGGTTFHHRHMREHLRWTSQQAVRVGDELVIRVLDQAACDEPKKRHYYQPVDQREERRRQYEELKKEFEGTQARP